MGFNIVCQGRNFGCETERGKEWILKRYSLIMRDMFLTIG